ncbi:DUF1573 domain-containing protein [Cesiribacter sp. SM1]|uniref:DUF1573 domain-containing protein n=1 Tax=Cesiribacter sp. SM1 TaxID=2861196 RepID=UPI001CD62E7B|nr:DUF1573 domain-containing protein [Cesiribacter sp. SM1]
MKKNFLLALAVAGMFTACNNADSDSRVKELENRLAALEAEKGSAATTVSQDAPQLVTEQNANTAPTGPVAKIEYQETEYDFGTVKDGEVVTHTFKFKNTGDVPLVIQSASASCGCTVPKKPEQPIAPGATGEIQVRFDSSNKPGIQNKTVTVTANTDPAITRLAIKGTVEPKASAAVSTEGPVRN